MDPTLADSEYLLVVNHLSIDRFDIVVANEKKTTTAKPRTLSSGSSVFLECHQYDNDTLYINGKKDQ